MTGVYRRIKKKDNEQIRLKALQKSLIAEVRKMNKQRASKHTLDILLSGLLVGLLSMGLFVTAAGAAPTSQPILQPVPDRLHAAAAQDSKACADCHPNVNSSWAASPHAHAFDDQEFSARWTALGKPGECLACHTTNYQSSSNTFAAEGVQCEACHGEVVEGHPPAVVPVKADTDYCGACHTTTLSEWRLTGHGTAGVGCMDCHDPHSQKPLFEDPDDMCINCHKEDMGPYLEDLHIQKGIGCVDCHALVIPPDPLPDDGIVPTGHAFTITPGTCVACHTDALHAGFSLPGYEEGAKAANGKSVNGEGTVETNVALEVLPENIHGKTELSSEQRIQALEAALASTRLSTLFQGGIIGIVFGGITVYYLGRNRRQSEPEAETGQPEEEQIVSDDDMLDEQLEKVLVSIERFIDRIVSSARQVTGKVKNEKPAKQNDRSPKSK
jgi:predicted CXXCH cytochrome family protein